MVNYYFYNLNYNLGDNVHDSCALVALGMLLSYYDTYWDDDFIPSAFEQNIEVNLYPQLSIESPGIISDSVFRDQYNTQLYMFNRYFNHAMENKLEYFHYYLMNYACTESYININSGDFGLSKEETINILSKYLYDRNLTGVSIQNCTGATRELTYALIANQIDAGRPVLIAGYNAYNGHAMVAYDYSLNSDGTVGDIYVHAGMITGDDGPKTHVSLSSSGYTDEIYAYYLNVTTPHSCTDNYVNASNHAFCSCWFHEHPSHASHEHYYLYSPYSSTQHKGICASCSYTIYASHVVAAGSLNITRCLDCGAKVNLELGQGTLQNIEHGNNLMGCNDTVVVTSNGSYKLPNGIIVLVEADVESYLTGELILQ